MQMKRKAAAGHFGGKGFVFVRRSELEQKHIPKRRDDYRGKPNEFPRDAIETRKRHKAAKGRRGDGAAAAGGTADGDGADKDSKRIMSANFEELCDDDRILVYFKTLLNGWKQELDAMTEQERRTADGKHMIATFQERARELAPLFDLCRKKVVPNDIRQALLVIVECCMNYNCLAESEHYIKLGTGHAPWPVGVPAVGIHERSARGKIHAKSVAQIMNPAHCS